MKYMGKMLPVILQILYACNANDTSALQMYRTQMDFLFFLMAS